MSGDNPTPQEEVYYSLEQAVEDLIETRNIWVSAGDGDLEKVKAYIAGGQSVNAQDDYGYTPLWVYIVVPPAPPPLSHP